VKEEENREKGLVFVRTDNIFAICYKMKRLSHFLFIIFCVFHLIQRIFFWTGVGVVWNKKSFAYGPGKKLWRAGDVVQIYIDLDNKLMQFGLNGNCYGIAFVCHFNNDRCTYLSNKQIVCLTFCFFGNSTAKF
jgi:hypothetical protein